MTSSHQPPKSTQILVVGGGPAGSYAAAALAREGFNVTLLEGAKFPRYHIGESLLPSVRPFLAFIGAEDVIKSYGFAFKPGAAVKLNQYKREGYTDFISIDPTNGAWNVVRSEFDQLLLRHAASCGVRVAEETQVTELHFSTTNENQPVAASWKRPSGEQGRIEFEYLIDASGRNGIMSTRYLRNRKFNKSLNNVACWGYWENTDRYMPNTKRENAVWIEALEDESGWVWFIPLHNGSTSIGIVMDQDISINKKRSGRDFAGKRGYGLQDHYLEELRRAPGVMKLIGEGWLRNKDKPEAVKAASDYSYAASSYAGPHYRIAGDAGAFIDPFFSSGVHLACTGALSAAITVAASIRGSATEEEAQRWHTSKVGVAYTRFLIVVLGTYQQIRNQSAPVMSDVNEDNFDRAFDLLRPVIQGTADVGKTLVEDELQKTMNFCRNMFAPTSPEMYESVHKRLDPELLSPMGPILLDSDVDRVISADDEEAKLVLSKVNARKPIHAMYSATEHFAHELHFGFKAVLESGKLGLVHGDSGP
ncbi:putative halogenase [Butyriboletus roseoflavus]|nr:putative halogenase [Butyriboletus roseoflavus]